MYRRAQRLFHTFNRVKDDARSAGAKQDGSDHHVQTIKTAGRKKTRDRVGSAFNEDTAESEVREAGKDVGRSHMSICRRKREHLDARECTRCSTCRYHQPSSAITVEQPRRRRQTSARIEYYTSRMRTIDAANCELRIIDKSSSYSDNDSVNDGAKAMQMRKSGRSIDVMGIAADRSDPTIERLSDLTDDKEFVDAPHTQRSEGVLPRGGQQVGRRSEQRGNNPPRLAQIDGAAHNFSSAPNLFKTKEKDGRIQGGSATIPLV
jgi:ferredoxin